VHTAPCTTGQLRLAGGNIDNEGRVEICTKKVWGTVCSDFWDTTDATVTCQELGYSTDGQKHLPPCTAFDYTSYYDCSMFTPTGAVAFINAHFGADNGPIHLGSVECSGSENHLLDCPRSSFVNCYSGHRGAGVRCQGECLS